MIESWKTFARERGHRFHEDPDPSITAKHEGIEVHVHTHRGLAGGWITHVEAVPRLALHGSVFLAPARGLHRLRKPGPLPGFALRSSSDSVAAAVLDERVMATLRLLGPRLVELAYTPRHVELSWHDVEHDTTTLEEAIACIAHLAVALARTPYR